MMSRTLTGLRCTLDDRAGNRNADTGRPPYVVVFSVYTTVGGIFVAPIDFNFSSAFFFATRSSTVLFVCLCV